MATLIYASLSELKAYMNADTDTEDDANFNGCLLAASRHIDKYCGRRFWIDDTASDRVYRTRGRISQLPEGNLLLVDDIATDAGLTVESWNGSTYDGVSSTSYELNPESDVELSKPATGILFPGLVVSAYRKMRVTAKWGWPSVPSEVKQACMIQASRLYQRKDSPSGVMGDANWGLIRVPFMDPDVKSLLQHFRMPGFG